MGKTYTKKIEGRISRLNQLPRSERLKKNALIKKKENRVLDSSEKHALLMTTEYGDILKLWEVLRTIDSKGVQGLSEAQIKRKKKLLKTKKRLETNPVSTLTSAASPKITKFAEDSEEERDEQIIENNDVIDNSIELKNASFLKKKDVIKTNKMVRPSKEALKDKYIHKSDTINKLFALIEPRFSSFARTPRISRVIQSMIKYGTGEHLDKITTLICSDFCSFCSDAFAHFIIIALFKHATHAIFRRLLKELIVIMPQIVVQIYGLQVIQVAYTSKLIAPEEKKYLVLGIFKDNILIKTLEGYPNIEEMIKKNEGHKKRLLTTIYNYVDKLIHQKEAYLHPFAQTLTGIFVRNGTKEEIVDLCEVLRPKLAEIAKTGKEGALLCNSVFALLEPKLRKEPLRRFGEDFLTLACGKYAAPIIARLFDLVYDAQLLYRHIVSKMIENLPSIIISPYGYLIILHLLTPLQSRKDKLLLHFWKEYNLYSIENNNWNKYTWLDSNYTQETIEISPDKAEKTHKALLPYIIQALIKYASDKKTVDSSIKISNHHLGIIAKELLCLKDLDTYSDLFKDVNVDIIKSHILKGEKRQREERDLEKEEKMSKLKRIESKKSSIYLDRTNKTSNNGVKQEKIKKNIEKKTKLEIETTIKTSIPVFKDSKDNEGDNNSPVELSSRRPINTMSAVKLSTKLKTRNKNGSFNKI